MRNLFHSILISDCTILLGTSVLCDPRLLCNELVSLESGMRGTMRDRTEVRHHLKSETFDVKSWKFFLSRGRDLSWSSPRGSVCCFLLSSSPRLAVACRFSGDSTRCASWNLIVVSDLIPEHLYLPSSTLAVSAHLHVHGREAPRSTGRTGQLTTEWLVELKLDGGHWTCNYSELHWSGHW